MSCHCTEAEWCCCRAGALGRASPARDAPSIHVSELTPPVPAPSGDGKPAESQVLSVLLPAQWLLSGTAAAATHLRWPWGCAGSLLDPLPGFLPRVWREGEANSQAVVLRGAGLWKVTGSLQASLVGFGSASLAVTLCQLKASVRLVCHFPKKIEFGTKVSVFFSCSSFTAACRGVWPTACPPPESPPSKGDILALAPLNCDVAEDESLTLVITSGNTAEFAP